jgi:hypothetical protein
MNAPALHIDPQTSALVLIDLQYGIVGMTDHEHGERRIPTILLQIVYQHRHCFR